MSGYTPGPWVYKGHGVIVGGPFRQFTNGQAQSQIAMVCLMTESATEDPSAEREANARLIAAAPALVEALKEAREEIKCFGDYAPEYSVTNELAKIDAALKSAGVELT